METRRDAPRTQGMKHHCVGIIILVGVILVPERSSGVIWRLKTIEFSPQQIYVDLFAGSARFAKAMRRLGFAVLKWDVQEGDH